MNNDTSTINQDSTEQKEIKIIGLIELAKLKKLQLVSKKFSSIIDNFITLLPPFISCTNHKIPRFSLESKEPISTIQLNAPIVFYN